MPIVRCAKCKKKFHKKASAISYVKRTYCSLRCCNEHKIRRVRFKCKECGKKFLLRPFEAKKVRAYCSRKCSAVHRNRIVTKQRDADKSYITKNYRTRALRIFGTKCSNKNCELKKHKISVPTELLDVDHKDSNRKNHKIENLRVLCVWCHAKKTRLEKKNVPVV